MLPEEAERGRGTFAVAALVVQTDFESWVAIKQAVESLGARIIFQKIGPPWKHLLIVDEADSRGRVP